jgi:hypothetical protein
MIKSKRGRKPKIKPIEEGQEHQIQDQIMENNSIHVDISNNLPKKRGRKPKGGKIIENTAIGEKLVHTMPNIIMHLQCTMDDVYNTFTTGISYNPNIISVEEYDTNDDFFKTNYTILDDCLAKSELKQSITKTPDTLDRFFIETNNPTDNSTVTIKQDKYISDGEQEHICVKTSSRVISQKLRELSLKLHNNICDNKSACFWCTCKFNTPNIYIPKSVQEDNIDVYGCFCSPECATSYLMNEDIDSSTKFERYSLINYIYGSIYDYRQNIKPAPNPYYTLDKFCGNLTIEEYRQHFTDENLLMVANKPQTRIFPELFEENSMSNNDIRYSINKFA